jgi:hypothetical protein
VVAGSPLEGIGHEGGEKVPDGPRDDDVVKEGQQDTHANNSLSKEDENNKKFLPTLHF